MFWLKCGWIKWFRLYIYNVGCAKKVKLVPGG
jgi:hypothetical protein